ncbi:hypothetical protein ACL02R_15190 [Streptomyces sp. MS19]
MLARSETAVEAAERRMDARRAALNAAQDPGLPRPARLFAAVGERSALR